MVCYNEFAIKKHAAIISNLYTVIDPHYEFEVLNWTYKGNGYTFFCINMTSQQWLTGLLETLFKEFTKLLLFIF